MAIATVYISAPPRDLFNFPPSREPKTLPAPAAGTFLTAPPFSISPTIYNAALDVKIPITIACTYAVTVSILNAYNRSNSNKPWAISRTRAFFWFVVVHNVFLAGYSAWTFNGMLGALIRTWVPIDGANGLAGVVDSMCKIHGPRGLGSAITYNPALHTWISENPTKVLLSNLGTPEATDIGRLWNEGLAFYGWWFYLSKFYEVLDTLIIIAKGKRSTTLQTYHHAGAMMCMWAGIRYMSPPIWMFVFINSGIHAMMYTYYTLTAFRVPVPQAIKQSLTTMQIVQFLVGASYAALHSFTFYDIPVEVITTSSSSSVTSVASAATVIPSAGFGSVLKKFLLRAAGDEGVAQNVVGANPVVPQYASDLTSTIPQYHTEYQTTPCINTSGQTFAIWLNVLYLTPLTVLFVRFFVKSYLRRSKVSSGSGRHENIEKAGLDALKGIERELNEKGSNGILTEQANGHSRASEKANGRVKENGKVNGAFIGHEGQKGSAISHDVMLEGRQTVMKVPEGEANDVTLRGGN